LRNVTRTAPYFHNGSVEKIEEAVRIMSKYQIGSEFTPEQIDDVVAFLKTLEGEPVSYDIK
jgi:cytochrome c peroxidase